MEENVREQAAREDAPNVRVMTEAERENYQGVTLEQAPDGQTYTGDKDQAEREAAERLHVVFAQGDAKGLRDELLRRFLGNHWKLKLIGIGSAIALAVFLFFIALPAVAMFVVLGGILFLIAQLFSF